MVPSVESLGWLPFHRRLVEALRSQEPETWDWFAKRRDDPEEQQAIRLELLKQAVRLDREDEPQLYQWVDLARTRLDLAHEVTLYRAQHFDQLNSSVVCLPDSCHVIFHGPVEERLDETECIALLGHELGHVRLWSRDDAALLIADQILSAWAQEPQSTDAWAETCRLHRLYAEIYCDRAAYLATNDLHATIAALVKLETGAKRVQPGSYLKQAEEILAGAAATSRGESHPETFVRAQALKWWVDGERDTDERIARLIEGPGELSALSLTEQPVWRQWTSDLIHHLLQPAWRKSDLTAAHARLFQDGESRTESRRSLAEVDAQIAEASQSLHDYACYLLLDFATCDRQIQEVALAQALQWTERWGFQARFAEIVRRELRLRKSQVDSLRAQTAELLAAAEQEAADQRSTEESAS